MGQPTGRIRAVAWVAEGPDDLLLDALAPLRFRVRVTRRRWELITTAKHPIMAGRESLVRAALEAPDEVRQSRIDPQVLLFYTAEATRRWTCAVAKRAAEGRFSITSGRAIGFEKLNFLVPESDAVHVGLETTRA